MLSPAEREKAAELVSSWLILPVSSNIAAKPDLVWSPVPRSSGGWQRRS